jgi:hypothetical protein
MTTFIYILYCPIDCILKYVGKSNDPEKRLRDHCLDFRCMDLQKAAWIRKLKAKKLKPRLIIIDEIDVDDWKDKEEFWCNYFKGYGYQLYNKRSRNGLTFRNSTTFKPGNIPWNKKIDFQHTAEDPNDPPF